MILIATNPLRIEASCSCRISGCASYRSARISGPTFPPAPAFHKNRQPRIYRNHRLSEQNKFLQPLDLFQRTKIQQQEKQDTNTKHELINSSARKTHDTTPILNYSPNADINTPRSQHSDIIMQGTTTSMHKRKPNGPYRCTAQTHGTLPFPSPAVSPLPHMPKKKATNVFLNLCCLYFAPPYLYSKRCTRYMSPQRSNFVDVSKYINNADVEFEKKL